MRRAVLSLAPSAVLGLATAALGLTDNWQVAGVPVGDSNFGDLNVIFIASQCAAIDPSWSAASDPCLPGMSHYNYPSIWAKTFGFLNANTTWTPIVAGILIGCFILSLIPLTWFALGSRREITTLTGITAAAMTPPIWLAFQRGNIDLFMFSLITIAVCLWVAQATKSAAAAIGIAALLKIFPIGAALMLFGPRRPRLGAVLTLTVLALTVAAINFRDLALISGRTPQIDGASFGMGLLPLLVSNQFNLNWTPTVFRTIGLLVFVTSLVLSAVAFRAPRFGQRLRQLTSEISVDAAGSALFLAGSGVFLISYVLGPSYDYRLVFLIPVIAGLLRVGSTFAIFGAALLILQMLLSYSTFVGPGEYLSDIMWLAIAPLMAVCSLRIIRQGRT